MRIQRTAKARKYLHGDLDRKGTNIIINLLT